MNKKGVERRKREGKLWLDSPQGFIEAQIVKFFAGRLNRTWPINVPGRFLLEKCIFGAFGKSWLEPPVNVCVGKNTRIGNNCYINFGASFVDDDKITIEDNVLFDPNVTIVTTGHPVHPDLRPHGEMYSAPVTVKKGAWLCANVTVLPGVTIGENVVIAAGSVVTKDVPANTVAMGVPCRVVQEITDRDREYYYKDRQISYGRIE